MFKTEFLFFNVECLSINKTPNVCLTGWLQPMLNKERLRIASPVFKLLLCRCDEAGDASRLGNNDIPSPKQIALNSAMKNRTTNAPRQPNLIKQRTTADVGMVLGFTWNKEEQGDSADIEPGPANTSEENSAIAGNQTELQSATKMLLIAP